MKTRTSDFHNLKTQQPEFSFQYEDHSGVYPRWVYVARDDGQPMRWATTKQRDAARLCFSSRRHPARAMADLQSLRLHLNQPGQAEATPSTTTESQA